MPGPRRLSPGGGGGVLQVVSQRISRGRANRRSGRACEQARDVIAADVGRLGWAVVLGSTVPA